MCELFYLIMDCYILYHQYFLKWPFFYTGSKGFANMYKISVIVIDKPTWLGGTNYMSKSMRMLYVTYTTRQ